MNALAERLQRLRRQAGAPVAPVRAAVGVAAPPPPAVGAFAVGSCAAANASEADPAHPPARTPGAARSAGAAPASQAGAGDSAVPATIATLRRLLGLRARAAAAPVPRAADRALPGTQIAAGLWLHERRQAWPPPPSSLDLAAFGHGAATPGQLHFFDTETTGLAGGTGTRAFMLGLGDWHEDAFRVRQLTLTAFAGEAAMLATFAGWLPRDAVLVSYNGRSYDAPLLATRYRLARQPSPLPGLAHLDLLYPVRRRYRGVWANCRLATIERELLGVVREDDLPGSEAPRAWREWLAGGSARDLRRVGAHNHQDLCSLAALLLRLVQPA